MSDAKPLASLSSGLLARKGSARPAMRRQNIMSSPANGAAPQEDLGWNDMGYDVDPPKRPEPVSISDNDDGDDDRKVGVLAAAIPEVVRQQDSLQEKLAGMNEAETESSSRSELTKDSASSAIEAVSGDAVNEENPPVLGDYGSTVDISADQGGKEPIEPTHGDAAIEPVVQSPLWSKPSAGKDPVIPASSYKAVGNSEDDTGNALSSDNAPVDESLTQDPMVEEGSEEISAARSVLSKKPAKTLEKAKAKAAKSTISVDDDKPARKVKPVKSPKRSIKAAKAAAGKRAAFTLRLDPERHLRLRLACAIRNQSAQNLVTQALDQFLGTLPEIEAMTGSLPATGGGDSN